MQILCSARSPPTTWSSAKYRCQGPHKCNSKNPYNSTKKPLICGCAAHGCIGVGKFFGLRRIFARILPNLPEKKNSIKKWPPKQSSSCYFGRHWASILLIFSVTFWRFSEILPRFPRIFTKSTFGGAFAPPPPTPVMQHKIGVLW